MKGWLKFLVVLALMGMLVSTLVACACEGGGTTATPTLAHTPTPTPTATQSSGGGGSVCSSTPDNAIKGSFQALESKDADKLVSYCAEQYRAEVRAKMAYAFSLVDQFKITNLKISTVSKTEDTATLQVEFDRKITAEGSVTEEHVKQTYKLAKTDKCWQLLGDAISEETTLLNTPTPTPTPAPAPEDTVQSYLSSLGALDANGVSRCFTTALRDGIRQDVENFRSQVSMARISNTKISVVSKTQNKATVDVEYDMQITAFGQTQSQHIKEHLTLDKVTLAMVGDEWLISVRAGPGTW